MDGAMPATPAELFAGASPGQGVDDLAAAPPKAYIRDQLKKRNHASDTSSP
jgi:hypothetical protein